MITVKKVTPEDIRRIKYLNPLTSGFTLIIENLSIFRKPHLDTIPGMEIKSMPEDPNQKVLVINHQGTIPQYLEDLTKWCIENHERIPLSNDRALFPLIDYLMQFFFSRFPQMGKSLRDTYVKITRAWGVGDSTVEYLTSPFGYEVLIKDQKGKLKANAKYAKAISDQTQIYLEY